MPTSLISCSPMPRVVTHWEDLPSQRPSVHLWDGTAQTFLPPHFLHRYLQTVSPLCILYTVRALLKAVWSTQGLNKGGDNPGACEVCKKPGKVMGLKNIDKRLERAIGKMPGSINLKQSCFRLLFSVRRWRERAKRQKLNFSSLSFLHDCHLLNVPIYFLHESLVLDLLQLLGRNWSLAVPHV